MLHIIDEIGQRHIGFIHKVSRLGFCCQKLDLLCELLSQNNMDAEYAHQQRNCRVIGQKNLYIIMEISFYYQPQVNINRILIQLDTFCKKIQ